MNIRYVSQDLAWTASMQNSVQLKIVDPLVRHLNSRDFDLSVHLDIGWTKRPLAPRFELWIVLQTFDGKQNSILRREGTNFKTLVNEISADVREKLRQGLPAGSSMKSLLLRPIQFIFARA